LIVLGLTGSIGMGKSTAADMLRRKGVPVHDADAAVHRLLGPGGRAVKPVAALFPEALAGDRIDRNRLGDRVFGDTAALRKLESVLHPLVRRSSQDFLRSAARRRVPIVVLDIPLLFESGIEHTVDAVIVVSAPAAVQRQRVMRRPGMTEAKFRDILARQVPDAIKRRRATWVVQSGLGKFRTWRQLAQVLRDARGIHVSGIRHGVG
jgi:dephospho-CoA kinase